MPRLALRDVELEYEEIGDPAAPALLLIAGLGSQLVQWDVDFCRALADRGLRVIRFDNRDAGRPTRQGGLGTPDLGEAFARAGRGEPLGAPYGLDDMADDAAGLLDGLEIDAAHVAGMSLGGMIAQLLALRHPGRVASLTSIMSSTGRRDLPPPAPEAIAVMMQPLLPGREAFLTREIENARRFWGSGFAFDAARVRARAERAFERGLCPDGRVRQMLAALCAPDREPRLASLRVPTLVIHGDEDLLVRVECGVATARAISGARLEIVAGMGHDLPSGAWPRLVDAISAVAGCT